MKQLLRIPCLTLALTSAAFALPQPTGPVDAIISYRATAASNYVDASLWLLPDWSYITLSATGVASATAFNHAGSTGTYTITTDTSDPHLTDVAFDGSSTPFVIDFGNGRFAPPSASFADQFSWVTNPVRATVANTSARAYVSPGHPAIAGFVVAPNTSRTIVIRAVGPDLGQFGVTDAMVAPKLTLYRGNTLIGENTDWSDSQTNGTGANDPASITRLFRMIGAFPLTAGSKNCALVSALPAGAYTIQVTAADGQSSGTVLVETYFVP